jgi:hypothetical protein
MQNIETLVKQYEAVDNALLREALADKQKEQREKDKRRLIGALESVDGLVGCAVQNLRNARAIERAAKAELQKVADARAQFLKDANVEKFAEAVYGKGDARVARFVRQFDGIKNGDWV